jgi:N-acetylneuraminic acid mutarotase
MGNSLASPIFIAAIWLLGATYACGGETDDGSGGPSSLPCEGTGSVRWRKIAALAGVELKSAAVVWTGHEILVWGSQAGHPGFRYRPDTGTFTTISADGAPSPRGSPHSAWTGREMIIWGGAARANGGGSEVVTDGARYDPESDRWTPISAEHDLDPSYDAVAVWTGMEFIVWGGSVDRPGYTNKGARYRPDQDRWISMSTEGAPLPRTQAAGSWTGSELLVWGGTATFENGTRTDDVSTGGRYDPTSDTWRPTSLLGAPAPRASHTLSWANGEGVVWGGHTDGAAGGRYDPEADEWRELSAVGAPPLRIGHAAVSTGQRVVIVGGRLDGTVSAEGGIYDPSTDTWQELPEECSAPRANHAAVWTDSGAFFWGGVEPESPTTGALLITAP